MAYERAESPEKQRIIQELVPGKQGTLAHVIASLSMSPAEIAVIAGDLALKTASVEMGFIDRFSGTLIFTGLISDVEAAIHSILAYLEGTLGFTVCAVTRT